MLEHYFVFPHTVDRIRATCIGEPIERYVERLAEGGYAERTIRWRVPLLIQFGEFARARGAKTWPELPAHAEDFVAHWSKRWGCGTHGGEPRAGVAKEIRGPVEQFLRLIVPGFIGHVRQPVPRVPFADSAPDIIVYTR